MPPLLGVRGPRPLPSTREPTPRKQRWTLVGRSGGLLFVSLGFRRGIWVYGSQGPRGRTPLGPHARPRPYVPGPSGSCPLEPHRTSVPGRETLRRTSGTSLQDLPHTEGRDRKDSCLEDPVRLRLEEAEWVSPASPLAPTLLDGRRPSPSPGNHTRPQNRGDGPVRSHFTRWSPRGPSSTSGGSTRQGPPVGVGRCTEGTPGATCVRTGRKGRP